MRYVLALLSVWLALPCLADDLVILKLSDDSVVYVGIGEHGVVIYDSVTTIEPTPPTPPTPEPVGDGQLICVRPWSCTLDESDADLTIRESIDAAKSKIPYLRLLPGTLDQRMELHPAEAYRNLVEDKAKGWVFHVAPTARGPPVIVHQGPLDARAVLSWVGVPVFDWREHVDKAVMTKDALDDVTDVDFSQVDPALLGCLDESEFRREMYAAEYKNVNQLPGWRGLSSSEAKQWVERFPVERRAMSLLRIDEYQPYGSCVAWSGGNCRMESAYQATGGMFRRMKSFGSLFVRIGSPNRGAYIGDASDELFERGILPADGETDVDGNPYAHTHQIDGNFSESLPSGWEQTANAFRVQPYIVDNEDDARRVLLDCRLCTHFGRSSHALCGFTWESSNWWYKNSWGAAKWGLFGKCVGKDSRFYYSRTYQPVIRDETEILLVSDLRFQGTTPTPPELPHLKAYRHFDERLDEIRELLEKMQGPPKQAVKTTQTK